MVTKTAKQEQQPVRRIHRILGMDHAVDITAEQTGGAYSTCEVTTAPQEGVPPHVHAREDEAFFVLEGVFELLCGDKTVRLSAGEHVFAPRGVPHSFRNVGPGPGRVFVIINPGGFERCFEEMGNLPPGPPDIAKISAICAKYGCKIPI